MEDFQKQMKNIRDRYTTQAAMSLSPEITNIVNQASERAQQISLQTHQNVQNAKAQFEAAQLAMENQEATTNAFVAKMEESKNEMETQVSSAINDAYGKLIQVGEGNPQDQQNISLAYGQISGSLHGVQLENLNYIAQMEDSMRIGGEGYEGPPVGEFGSIPPNMVANTMKSMFGL